MAKVELKQPIVEEIANSVKDAQGVVLVNYSGITVEQDTVLRKELREAGVPVSYTHLLYNTSHNNKIIRVLRRKKACVT